jgi:hypothetical protein
MKSAYNNHLLKCKFANFSSKFDKSSEKNTDSETISIDSLKQNMTINNLFALVLMLYNKYEKMESDYNELKKYIAIVKNKINIVDYLNMHYSSCISITEFLDSIIFNQETIEGLNSAQMLIPIKCFSLKENVLYMFDSGVWTLSDDSNLRKFIKYFDKKILTQFVLWKTDAEKLFDSETFGEIYIQNMKKVIGGNFEKKNPIAMIKNRLYKHLKVDLKNIVHYDFV